MRPKLGVVQVLDGILHVLISDELHNARAVLKHVRIANIASDPEMVFQVLPAAR